MSGEAAPAKRFGAFLAAHRQRLALLWRDDFLARAEVAPEIDKSLKNVISTPLTAH